MRIHKIIENTLVEGPGKRTCIWTQGCNTKCPGCFNTQAQDLDGGEEMTPHEIVSKLAMNKEISGVTIAGGEPLLQVHELRVLLQHIRYVTPHLNIILYSGYDFEKIRQNREWFETVKLADVLIAGPFIQSQSPDPRRWVGSKNQDTIFFTDALRAQLTPWPKEDFKAELVISADSIEILGNAVDINLAELA
jgi:anaerobic ribonucleoside-triphosphate reductase activating protein